MKKKKSPFLRAMVSYGKFNDSCYLVIILIVYKVFFFLFFSLSLPPFLASLHHRDGPARTRVTPQRRCGVTTRARKFARSGHRPFTISDRTGFSSYSPAPLSYNFPTNCELDSDRKINDVFSRDLSRRPSLALT